MRERSTVEEPAKRPDSGTGRDGAESGPQCLGVNEIALVCPFDGGLELVGAQTRRKVDQGGGGASHRNASVTSHAEGGKSRSSVDGDAGTPMGLLSRHRNIDSAALSWAEFPQFRRTQ